MAKITWTKGPGDPDTNTWNGVVFKSGEAVEVNDEKMIAKAKGNPFFTIDGEPKPAETPRQQAPNAPGRVNDRDHRDHRAGNPVPEPKPVER